MTLTSFWVASALGRGKAETLANYRRREAPGMREITGDVQGRGLWFGMVPGELPAIEAPRWRMRTCQLLKLAVGSMPESGRLVARYGADRVGIVLGASNTGIDEAEPLVGRWLDEGVRPPEFSGSMLELGTPALYLRELLGVRGPAYTVSTACSSATKAFAAAARLLERGVVDAVITGGVDGRCRFAMNGFQALGALSAGRTRPLTPDRDGINLGEGVALFLMEREGVGLRLGGVGETSDAYHATAPDPEGRGAEAAMRGALAAAGLEPAAIEYLNLHGTGTLANDAMEMAAVERVFGARKPVYESTKNLTGHCLGAAGAVEAAVAALLIEAGDYRTAMSNSFAFGGSNAALILTR